MAKERLDSFELDGYQLGIEFQAVGSLQHSILTEISEANRDAVRTVLAEALRRCVEIMESQPLPANVSAGRADQHRRSIQDRMSE